MKIHKIGSKELLQVTSPLKARDKLRFDYILSDYSNGTDKESLLYKSPRSKDLVQIIYIHFQQLANPAKEPQDANVRQVKDFVNIAGYKSLLFDGLSIDKMREIIQELMIDQIFGCYTRQALPIIWQTIAPTVKWLVFFDLDFLHELNAKIGYDAADKKIAQALKLRQNDGSIIARWYSGDEFIVFGASGNYKGFISRLEKSLAQHGLSATFSGEIKKSNNYKVAIARLVAEVSKQKMNSRRKVTS